ncbi:DUF998 domain-containing protein [Mycolicibacterium moriokaense]|nr:DUF998 domain-containing protein [Mycolicibacterium moriokaense]
MGDRGSDRADLRGDAVLAGVVAASPGGTRVSAQSCETPNVPGWALATAIAAPAVLVVSGTLARIARAAAYDPITQTMSALAGRGGWDWIMTVGFVLSATCQILTAVGLRALRPLPRIALAVAGCCGLIVAAFPVTAHATNNAHILATGAGAIVLALWPVLCITNKKGSPSTVRARWTVAVSLVLLGMLAWVYYEATQGPDIGLAERTTAVGELTWPLIVVISARYRLRARA